MLNGTKNFICKEKPQHTVTDIMSTEKFCIKPGYIKREIAGEHIAVPIDTAGNAHIIALNPVSGFIWDRLSTEKSFDEILQAVLENFSVDEQTAAEHLREFLNELKENNLLK